jgi:hypothetical protein
MKKIIMTLLLLIVISSGCVKLQQSDYPIVVAWNDINYYISVEEVFKEELGNQIGEVKRLKKPMPKENGDANFIPIGSRIFKINEIEIKDSIAVEIDGKTYKAGPNGKLK